MGIYPEWLYPRNFHMRRKIWLCFYCWKTSFIIYTEQHRSCVPICVPYHNFNGIDKSNLCTSGALSNKYNVICLIGNLASGSTGALPAMCGPGQTCGVRIFSDFCLNDYLVNFCWSFIIRFFTKVTDNQVGYCNFASNCLSTDLGWYKE